MSTLSDSPTTADAASAAADPAEDLGLAHAEGVRRQAEILPPERLAAVPMITVVGTGAIGRALTIQLAQAGATRLTLIDPDTVERVNVSTQGWTHRQIGLPKVHALVEDVQALLKAHAIGSADWEIVPLPQTFREARDARRVPPYPDGVIFACPDRIDVRREVWNYAQAHSAYYGDGRMLGLSMRSFALEPRIEAHRDYYLTTLFEPEETEPGRCTAAGSCYTSWMISGLMMAQFAAYLRGDPARAMGLQLDLRGMHLTRLG